MDASLTKKIILSCVELVQCENSTEEIYQWIEAKNRTLDVQITKIKLSECKPWYYNHETGEIQNTNRSFFQITGLVQKEREEVAEQPIIIQDEIGYLGIICKEMKGVLHFLMQAKIEPGNINKIQISPTIQATKSNFMKKHGGKQPRYLEYFIHAKPDAIIVDQIQSEQASRFLKKRNRNIIIKVDEEVEVSPDHKWMTLGQIKAFMKQDNLVNMDTRTVLSCIPFCLSNLKENELKEIESKFKNKALYQSIFAQDNYDTIKEIYHYINDAKMFNDKHVERKALHELEHWSMNESEILCKKDYPFKVIFCNISIEGREVKQWTQPLFQAMGMAMFGLLICNDQGIMKFLVKAKPEIGCFDSLELGPSIQLEATEMEKEKDFIEQLFFEKLKHNKQIIHNAILSEEGGRFYHEQNRNVIIEISKDEIDSLPEGYFWIDYRTLNLMTQFNNCLNIQLRNLLSLLEV